MNVTLSQPLRDTNNYYTRYNRIMKNYENPEGRLTTSEAIRKDFAKNMFWYFLKENFPHRRVVEGTIFQAEERVRAKTCHLKETSRPENTEKIL